MPEPNWVQTGTLTFQIFSFYLNALVAIFGGYWTYTSFIRQRLSADRIELNCEAQAFGPFRSKYAVEISVLIKNVGQTRFQTDTLYLRIRGISGSDELEVRPLKEKEAEISKNFRGENTEKSAVANDPNAEEPAVATNLEAEEMEHNKGPLIEDPDIPILQFPKVFLKTRNVIPRKNEYMFVEPGATQRYTFNTAVCTDIRLLCIYVRLPYTDSNSDFHTAERIFDIQSILHQPPKSNS